MLSSERLFGLLIFCDTTMADPAISSTTYWTASRWIPLAVVLILVGCHDAGTPTNQSPAAFEAQRQASQSAALLRSAIARLGNLPYSIDLELTPPTVVLDSRSSLNGEDILATIDVTAGEPSGNLNQLTVRSENAGFLRRRIQSGDILKCFLVPDRESRERLSQTGDLSGAVLTHEALDFTVAQTLGPNSLRLSEGLRIPLRIAQELVTDLDPARVAVLESKGVINDDGIFLPPEILQQLAGIAWPFKIEVWRVRDDKMQEIKVDLSQFANRGEPAFGWEPTGDRQEFDQLLQRLNQWTRSREQPSDWAPAAVLSTIDPQLRAGEPLAEYVSDDALRRKTFADYESRLLQEAIWVRDISRWAAGDRFDPVQRGAKLFDWVVRNVTLSDDLRVQTNRPWQTLLAGRGSAAQRAWVFASLCRQQQLPVAVIEIPLNDADPWVLCALLSEGELSLFDPQLGMPLPADDTGKQIATLAAVQQDEKLLRQLDLPDSKYPLTSATLEKVEFNVVAEPLALSWRAGELETQLRGENALVLQANTEELAAEFSKLDAGAVKLWAQPFDFYRRRLKLGPRTRSALAIDFRPFAWRPLLWQARTLHFRGLFETEEEAREKAERKEDALYEAVNDHRSAAQRYSNRKVRPSDSRLAEVPREKRLVYQRAKVDATYWLGLLKYEQGAYKSSRQWLEYATLSKPEAAHRSDGVVYNRARALEALQELAAAADLLAADTSLQQHGNRLRARQLRARLKPKGTQNKTDAPTDDAGA